MVKHENVIAEDCKGVSGRASGKRIPFIKTRIKKLFCDQPGPEVIKPYPCSTQLSMNFFVLINVILPTTVGILTFMSRKNSILVLYEPDKCRISCYFYTYEHLKFHAQLSLA